jgi:NAD(P)-dependent dehydrogenase (short-subunit alcohol dehydrogenase family)
MVEPRTSTHRAVNPGSAIVWGVGAQRGLGAALARRLAWEGLKVVAVGRTGAKVDAVATAIEQSGGCCFARVVASGTTAEAQTVIQAAEEHAPLVLAVFNGGGNRWRDAMDTDEAFVMRMLQDNFVSGFNFARESARVMMTRGSGTILFTGASASLRGKATFAAFAAAKGAMRLAAQAFAREWHPKGIHVATAIIDGVIDGDRVNSRFPELAARKGTDGMLDVDAVADAYWQLHVQPRCAWTQELDLRPFSEPF